MAPRSSAPSSMRPLTTSMRRHCACARKTCRCRTAPHSRQPPCHRSKTWYRLPGRWCARNAERVPIPVTMPVLGLTMEEGTVAEWLKHEGDQVQKDEPLLLVEMDKGTQEVP